MTRVCCSNEPCGYRGNRKTLPPKDDCHVNHPFILSVAPHNVGEGCEDDRTFQRVTEEMGEDVSPHQSRPRSPGVRPSTGGAAAPPRSAIKISSSAGSAWPCPPRSPGGNSGEEEKMIIGLESQTESQARFLHKVASFSAPELSSNQHTPVERRRPTTALKAFQLIMALGLICMCLTGAASFISSSRGPRIPIICFIFCSKERHFH